MMHAQSFYGLYWQVFLCGVNILLRLAVIKQKMLWKFILINSSRAEEEVADETLDQISSLMQINEPTK